MTNDVHTSTTKRLRRSSTDRMVAGVCGGWARVLGVDAAILRIGLAVTTVLGIGTPILLYAICWLVMPRDDQDD